MPIGVGATDYTPSLFLHFLQMHTIMRIRIIPPTPLPAEIIMSFKGGLHFRFSGAVSMLVGKRGILFIVER